MTDQQNIIDKIRTLLEIAEKGATDAERENALAIALRLMQRHNIDQATIDTQQDGQFVYEAIFDAPRHSQAIDLVLTLVQHFFHVRFSRGWQFSPSNKKQRIYRAFGTPSNVAVARYLVVYLVREFERLYQQCRRLNPDVNKHSFLLGVFDCLFDRLEKQNTTMQRDEAALIRLQDKELDKSFNTLDLKKPATPPKKILDFQSIKSGIKASKGIIINQPLAATTTPHRITHEPPS